MRTNTRRHPSDLLRLGLGGSLLLWAAISAGSGDPSLAELNLFRLVNQLPPEAGAPLIGLMQLGALTAVPVIAVVCILAGRARLARLLLLGGAAAWAAAKALDAIVAQRPPDEQVKGVVLHGAVTPGLSFPSTHVAVAAAMATIAAPYVGRSMRRTAWLLVALVAVARVYVGAHFPVDVAGGFALGWMIGSLVHLMLGAPRGVPSPEALLRRFAELGTRAQSITPTRDRGSCFRMLTDDGSVLHVRVVDRERADADWLIRLWRMLAFRDALGTVSASDPTHAVEHEALVLLDAGREGVRVPEARWTEPIADGESVLVREWIEGEGLDRVVLASEPGTLVAAWRALAELHRRRVAYGSARLAGFVRTAAGVVPVHFADARQRADEDAIHHDVAELLASSAAAVGPMVAARCAREGVGPATMAAVLPALQPLTLSPETRAALRRSGCAIDQLRSEVAAAAGVEFEPTERPVLVVGRNLAPFVLGAVALVVLLAQIGNLSTALAEARNADPAWLAAAIGCALASYVMAAVSMMGAAPELLALGRTFVVQFAAAFTNRIAPAGLGAMATNVRYLERNGVRRTRAATAVGINAAAGVVVHVILLLTLVPLVGVRTSVRLPPAPDFPDIWPIVATILVVLSLAGLWYWRRRLTGVVERFRPHARDLRGVLAEPRRALLLFGGSLGVTTAQAFVFVASLHAVGIHRPVLTCVAVFLAGGAVAAAAPTPGGLGALEAALVAGLAQVGVPAAPAIAAVLISRVIGYWLPILPGWLAFRACLRNGIL